MKVKFSTTVFLIGTLLAPVVIYAADTNTDRSQPSSLIKDSLITTKIKAKLAAEHFASTFQIKVDTDNAGAVTLSGKAPSQAEADKAVSIVRETEGVSSVKSEIVVQSD